MKNDLIQFEIDGIVRRDGFLKKFQEAGFDNAKNLKVIKTKFYLGDFKGKKVIFYTTFTKDGIICKSNLDLETVGKNFDQLNTYLSGRTKSYVGNYPTTRKGESNISRITLAYLMAFSHICKYKKVGFVNDRPSKELVRELMYLTMPEVEGRNEDSKMYGITWQTVIDAWEFEACENYHLYKSYFNGCVKTDLKNMDDAEKPMLKSKVS
tara:strand:- start:232 stop:858 length:627 start_codon:yes stop_codon:yes gene_type:complete